MQVFTDLAGRSCLTRPDLIGKHEAFSACWHGRGIGGEFTLVDPLETLRYECAGELRG